MDRYILIAALAAIAQARFGQEQIPIAAIAQVQGGAPGAAATIAGAAISTLLGAADPCDKLSTADQIVSELGGGQDAIDAAIGLVQAEQNFNNFNQDVPNICTDPTLPATAELRGRTPLIDPGVTDADVANALSAQTAQTPLDATGKSIADLLTEAGFTSFNGAAAAGGAADAAATDAAANDTAADAAAAVDCNDEAAAAADAGVANATATAAAAADATATDAAAADATVTDTAAATDAAVVDCNDEAAAAADAGVDNATATDAAAADATATDAAAADATAADAANADAAAGGADDFGTCDPTMSFEGGRANRAADEFTFQSNDPVIAANQQEALNPNIITNRICDELVNICGANDAAIATCEDAQAQILALGTRDQTTADAWNQLVGGGAARRMRRGLRM